MINNFNKIIQLAWHDKISFDEIKRKLNVSEDNVIKIICANLKPSLFKLWRKRVNDGRSQYQKKSEILSNFEDYKIQAHEVN